MKKKSKIFFPLLLFLFLIITAYFFITRYISPPPSKSAIYAGRLKIKQKVYTSFEGEKVKIPIEVKNQSQTSWSSQGKHPCFISFHLFDEKGKLIKFDNRRFPLPGKIGPGQSIKMAVGLISPLEKGNYILEFDLLKEGLFWFKSRGFSTSAINLKVKARNWPEDSFDLGLDYGGYTKFKSSLSELNKIAKLIRLTLYQNQLEFRGKTGKIKGFAAGFNYPQIWLRDANTIIPAARYFYDPSWLYSWLEEHLFFQKDNGSLYDWIDSQGRTDKNTTETDQEASAVQAAYKVFELVGPSWLQRPIRKKTIGQRLGKALDYVFSSRFNKKFGLVKGAHTPDWGDIDMIDQDQQAIYVDDKTHWTADIYDQSMIYQACLYLSQMLKAVGEKEKSSFWSKRADNIRINTNKWLWQDNKGFYKIHLHLDSLKHNFNENNILAVGGNTLAIISGLADSSKAAKIIKQIIKRQKLYQVSTISATLLPPYPKNFFKHPMVDDPYEYQNGGQGDWFGGRLIYAMFEAGFSHLAKQKLMEILHKDLNNKTFYEWDNRSGLGQGSQFFCASAGSLSKAIYEGYFGFKWLGKGLNLEPKLAQDSAKIHLYFPANDIYVAYEYRYYNNPDKIIMRYQSNYPHQGLIKILSPWTQAVTSKKSTDLNLTVKIDGHQTDFSCQQKNNDLLIIISTDFKNHTLEVTKEN